MARPAGQTWDQPAGLRNLIPPREGDHNVNKITDTDDDRKSLESLLGFPLSPAGWLDDQIAAGTFSGAVMLEYDDEAELLLYGPRIEDHNVHIPVKAGTREVLESWLAENYPGS